MSKGSDYIKSMNGAVGQGVINTNNSIGVSGTPTDNVSNYFNS
jgi:hypothetical protein